MQTRFAAWVEEYSLPLLKWALNKTGSRAGAEELAQEVWLQFFAAARKEERSGSAIREPEHLLWKVARYVWCKQLRTLTVHRTLPLEDTYPAPEDFAADLADDQEQLQLSAWLHRRIVNLSRLQREAMILCYVEQLPQREIARRLGVSEGTLRWHLFETRRKLREGASDMKQTEFVYTPRTLHMGINGQDTPNNAVNRIRESLLMQNICCACYQAGRTAQELAEMLGVARPYVEHDLTWLTEQELLRERGGRYYTDFLITTSRQEAEMFRVFEQHKATLCDVITRHLLGSEAIIRDIGFTGSDRPMAKLLWLLIYLFTRRLPMLTDMPEPPIRPDGGKYWPLGFDRTEPTDARRCFDYNGSMCNDGFYWFGLHNFGQSEIEDMMDAWTPEYKALRQLLEKLIWSGFDRACVAEGEQYVLARLIEKGFVVSSADGLAPNFVIFTKTQYDRLYQEVFRPLAEQLQEEVCRLSADLYSIADAMLPPHLKHLARLSQAMAEHDVAFTTELMAFHDGTLYHPADKRDGEFLTLAYIFRNDT